MSESGTTEASPLSHRGASLRVFINYRRDDTVGWALLLHDRLAARFGADNVFLDLRTLKPGMRWLEEIKTHGAGCGVFLALIGTRWKSSMPPPGAHAAEDYVRFEIEYALRRNSGVEVVPVIVGSAVPPTRDGLPSSLQPLTSFQVARLREDRFDEDVDQLISRLEEISRAAAGADVVRAEPRQTAPERTEPVDAAPPPGQAHYDVVLRHLVDEGNVVPLLGSHLRRSTRDAAWHEGCGAPPDADDLAAALARQVDIEDAATHLAQVAQYVYETQGRADLYRPLTRLCGAGCDPGPVHRFLAELPQRFEQVGIDPRYQLIVSTNFDTALERAFDEAHEPYDLAVYMASGPERGLFVHFPYEDVTPKTIAVPNAYPGFPIDEYGELGRTVIVKVHGAVDGNSGDFRWRENYVITEDHYIDYLSRSPVESLVPIQILDKLRDSHCLFLGYTMRDWSVRVFLKRIWGRQPLGAKSWAIEPDVDTLEREFWTHSNVDVFTSTAADYVERLGAQIDARAPADAGP
jgi:hypothetical protein